MIAYTRNEIISATDLARNVSATLSSLEKQFEDNKLKYNEEVLKYTYPIFENKDDVSKPELIGSSIIIYLDDEFYLVTAAHVMIDTNGFFSVGVDNKILSDEWNLVYSVSDKNNEDGFDIGFIKLDKKWIEKHKIIAFHVNDESIASNNVEKYFGLLCGFPATSNMNSSKKSWRKNPNNYRLEPYCYPNTILAHKEEESIVMDYGKNNKNQQPKKLNGMSGCGMWACHIVTYRLELLGVFIEHHKREKENKKDALYATPIKEVIEFICKHSD